MAEKKKVKPPVEQLVDADARKKALKMALDQISKQFGKDAILSMGSQPDQNLDVVSTGSFTLDLALGVGGLPRGRIVEIYGPESSGKTTLTLHILAEMQKLGGTCAFIDAEHALDVKYAKALGVKVDDLLLSQPDSGEQALEITDALVRSGAVDLVVIDSVAALCMRKQAEQTGTQRLVSGFEMEGHAGEAGLLIVVDSVRALQDAVLHFHAAEGAVHGS